MNAVASGTAKLTDPQYVKAAQAVADLGTKGYFGKGVGSIDYDTAVNTFLTGKAAMLYMGTWVLANVSDPKADTIGARQHRIHAVPGRRRRQRVTATSTRPTSACRSRSAPRPCGPKVARVAEVHRARTTAPACSRTTERYSGFNLGTPVPGLSALQTQVQSDHGQLDAERAVVRGAVQHQGDHGEPAERRTTGERQHDRRALS